MWAQLSPRFKEHGRRLLCWLAVAGDHLRRGVHAAWVVLRPPLVFTLNVLIALLLLFEEWGWRPLSNLLAQLARFRIWALFELWIAGLPPYGALAALAVPSSILVPAKLFGVYLLALGHVLSATLVLLAAKAASTALIARIFILTKPALMQIGWLKRAYDAFVPWQEALFARIRNSWVWRNGRIVKRRVNAYVQRVWASVRPQIEALRARLWPKLATRAQSQRVAARAILAQGAQAGRGFVRWLGSLAELKRH